MDLNAIRAKAEAMVDQSFDINELLQDQDLKEILHELRVHQVELEMQNDELRRTQEKLINTRKEYFELYNFAPVAYLTLDEHGIIKNINLQGAQMLGRDRRHLNNKPLLPHIHTDYRAHFFEFLQEVFNTNLRVQDELKLATSELYVTLDASTMVDEEGLPHCRLVMTDVTYLRQMERTLRTEKEQLIVTLRSIAAGVIVCDHRGLVTLANNAAHDILRIGWPRLQGQALLNVFNIADEDEGQPLAPVVLQLLERDTVTLPPTAMLKDTTEDPKPISMNVAPIREAGVTIVIVIVFKDETMNRRRQTELLRTRQLQSLGVLAGGIAHDFNNHLTAIQGNIELARMKNGRYAAGDYLLVRAIDSCEQSQLLSQQLLTFAKGGYPIVEVFPLDNLVRQSVKFALSGSDIRADFEVDSDLPWAKADPRQITQVVHNVVSNAIDAITKSKVIQVSLKQKTITQQSTEDSLASGVYLVITVVDHGAGIPAETMPRIFEPYFTTKDIGNGLGLTTAYSIAKRHHGDLTVQSTPGVGTTVKIYLPACNAIVDDCPQSKVESSASASASARVLVMDDDADVLQLLSEILEVLDYRAEMVSTGEAMLDTYQAALNSDPFDLAILDLTIAGGMGGREAIAHLLKIDPDAKAIVSSGYTNDPVMANFQEYGFKGVVAKPYRLSNLKVILNQILE